MDDEHRVLLIQRVDDGTWGGLPGGSIEPPDSWSRAAIRECLEETGWIVRIIGLSGVYSDPVTQAHVYPDGRCVQLLGVVFRAELVERVGEPSEESVEVGFFGLDEMPEPLFAPDRPVLADLSAPA